MSDEKAVATATPQSLLEMAVSQGAEIDKLEKLMELQIRWDEQQAKKAYAAAMAKFKSNPPKITKDAHVQYDTQKGKTDYKHTTLGHATTEINKELSKYGLHASWRTGQENGHVSVTCTIAHEQGHSESTTLFASPDSSGGKNNIQAIGSTVTYLERYTLFALTGLAAEGQDDDGKGMVEYITEKQVSQITDAINKVKADKDAFLQWIGAETVEEITQKDFKKAMAALKAKEKK